MLLVTLLAVVYLVTLSCVEAKWEAQVERREAVKEAFKYNYRMYEEHAYPYDLLVPISKYGADNGILAGFGGSVVDSMSTMLVMDMADSDEYKRALVHAKHIDFSHTKMGQTPGQVSIFELTIRYLGGLISAFQLGGEKAEEKFLIDQAASLANRLSWGWVGKNRIPYNSVNINDGVTYRAQSSNAANLAEAGTLVMEWGTLSDLTGNKTYRRLAEGSMSAIFESEPIFPGLWAQEIWADREIAKGDYLTWGGASDSFFEYLIKYPFLEGNSDHYYLKAYTDAVDSSIKHLLKRTGVGNLTFLSDHSTQRGNGSIYIHSHLACFSGGNIAMAGKLMKRDDWVEVGLQLSESCAMTYERSATGIGPVAFGWFDSEAKAEGWDYVSPSRRRFYNENGFFISSPEWNHMPETMESVFYAYRITGQEFWRDIAWRAFLNIRDACDTGNGWAGVKNVNDRSAGSYDETQTFLFAELLKYLYLIFDDPERFSVDEYVFNTEAHPQKRKKGGDFGKIQGTNHRYSRIASTNSSRVSLKPSLDDSESLFYHANEQEQQLTSDFRLPSRTVPSYGGCQEKGFRRYIFCYSYVLLLIPFALLVFYRVSHWIHTRMRRADQKLYDHNSFAASKGRFVDL
ncbi:hypothetical protein CBS101457_006857 [Exobasidium rhododendri]|nr:hypothetical protein CBS101457_006857 [Exobasidium rhododendri]